FCAKKFGKGAINSLSSSELLKLPRFESQFQHRTNWSQTWANLRRRGRRIGGKGHIHCNAGGKVRESRCAFNETIQEGSLPDKLGKFSERAITEPTERFVFFAHREAPAEMG